MSAAHGTDVPYLPIAKVLRFDSMTVAL